MLKHRFADKTAPIVFRLRPDQADWIDAESTRLGESKNTIVRAIFNMAMEGKLRLSATLHPHNESGLNDHSDANIH